MMLMRSQTSVVLKIAKHIQNERRKDKTKLEKKKIIRINKQTNK